MFKLITRLLSNKVPHHKPLHFIDAGDGVLEAEHVDRLRAICGYFGELDFNIASQHRIQLESAYAYFETMGKLAQYEQLVNAAMLAIVNNWYPPAKS